MPKDNIDYSNTIIYKIYCNDETISDIYIGHTTNFVKRKYQHKILCNSQKTIKIYDIIRKHGGWENWNMIELAKYNCKDVTEARIREQEYIDLLKPTLNKIKAITNEPDKIALIDNLNNDSCFNKQFDCENINIDIADNQNVINKDNNNSNIINISGSKYSCSKCNLFTNNKKDYSKHLLTKKHNEIFKPSKNDINYDKQFICSICNKKYSDNSGLWKHKKKCKKLDDNKIINPEFILNIVKTNKELANIILEQNKIIVDMKNKIGCC